MTSGGSITFDAVSRFYGDVLGVNQITLEIGPGVTSLVGANGAGKTTLLNLMTGLIQPTSGSVRVLGHTPMEFEVFPRLVGYSTQFDSFGKGLTGRDHLIHRLRMFGSGKSEARVRAGEMLERVGLLEAAGRKVSGYSKGMRQRLHLASALLNDPPVLVLDEPLNGLDPMARADLIRQFRSLASQGRHVVVSSHILHEVDQLSDHVVMMDHGYVVAEGKIEGVREELSDEPSSILISCSQPAGVAGRSFEAPHVVSARLIEDPPGLVVRTREPEAYLRFLNQIVLDAGVAIDHVALTDGDTDSVYGYLTGGSR